MFLAMLFYQKAAILSQPEVFVEVPPVFAKLRGMSHVRVAQSRCRATVFKLLLLLLLVGYLNVSRGPSNSSHRSHWFKEKETRSMSLAGEPQTML